MTQRCASTIWFTADNPKQVATFQCRREDGHEGNHSTNACETCFAPKDMTDPARPTRIAFRIDWRGTDGVVVPKEILEQVDEL